MVRLSDVRRRAAPRPAHVGEGEVFVRLGFTAGENGRRSVDVEDVDAGAVIHGLLHARLDEVLVGGVERVGGEGRAARLDDEPLGLPFSRLMACPA
jgi:hypothetical protein